MHLFRVYFESLKFYFTVFDTCRDDKIQIENRSTFLKKIRQIKESDLTFDSLRSHNVHLFTHVHTHVLVTHTHSPITHIKYTKSVRL